MHTTSQGIKAVIFDFGGVLIDWNPRYLYRTLSGGDDTAVERFFEEVGFFEWNLELDCGKPFKTAVAELCARFPAYTQWITAYDERWEESVSGPIKPVVKILYTLHRKGYPLYGLSNWSIEKFQLLRPKYAFFNCFRMILVSGEARVLKPDPRIFTLFLQKSGQIAGECLFIDDSAANIAAAAHLGFHTIGFESSIHLETALKNRGILDP